MACHVPLFYLSNELSCLKKGNGMTKIPLSQARTINGTLPKEKINLEHWVTSLKI